MAVIHETQVDGVPCFWVNTGRPTLAARLAFRFGSADEPVVESGWQHALEHLALHDRGGGPLQINGSVALLETDLTAHGPPDAVAAHLISVAEWLADPQLNRLRTELGVLQAESGLRGESAVVRALTWRFGAGGPGVIGYGEAGLARATTEALVARAHVAFASGNAVLALDGPPPPGLRLPLPEGPRIPVPVAVPVERHPGRYRDDSGLVLSGLIPRSAAMVIGHEALQHALSERLRTEEGGAYAPWSTYEPVDANHAVIVAGSDLAPRLVASIVPAARELIQTLSSQGLKAAKVEELVALRRQAVLDPYNAYGLALRASTRVLRDEPVEQLDDLLTELDSIKPDDIRAGFREVGRSLLIGAPAAASHTATLRDLTMTSVPAHPAGDHYRSSNWPAPGSSLVIGTHTVEITEGQTAVQANIRPAAAPNRRAP